MSIQQFLLPVLLGSVLALVSCNDNNKKPKVNHAPTAADLTQSTQADTDLKGTLMGSDSDGDALAFSVVSQPTNGSVMVNSDGSFTYKPKADSTGTDQFTYKVSDGVYESAAATVNITINPLDVNFGSYSRKVFEQTATATPLPLDTRNVTQDVTDPTAFDDLLK